MTGMSGGKALVRSVLNQGVDTIFTIPGVQLDHFFNALHDEGNAVRVIQVRHEQAAAYMAFGYAQSTGRVGCFAVVPGPGLLNTTAALATAYGCNAPVLCLAGQVPTRHIGRGLGMLHEIPDQLAILRGLTKWAGRINHPSEVPAAVAEAFRQLQSGRPQPVGLEMPPDQMARRAAVTALEAQAPPPPLEPDPELVKAAAKLLGEAQSPMIFAGSGAIGAEAELKQLAELLQAPVVTHRMGKGVLSDRHYLAQSTVAAKKIWPQVDVIVGVGSRLQGPRMQWPERGPAAPRKIVHIDIDPTEIGRIGRADVSLVADARETLKALLPVLEKQNRQRPSREEELTALKAEVMARFDAELGPQMGYSRALRAALPDDGIMVDELTQVGYMNRAAFPVYQPRTFISTGYQGTLGFGFATALGVKVAHPERPVLSINGDGGFLYTMPELATAVQHGINVVAVVFNDGAYGNVRRMQKNEYGGRLIATDLKNPDFVGLAQSFGALGLRAGSPDELKGAIETGFAHPGPVLIDAPVGEMPDPWQTLESTAIKQKN
ncbi:MAG TPA: thiamine pyrophosphate-binding protein [Alphaproteobacteria bacterium]|nr:thiamine pyrophosphate-binding protein [Alphaproteobacteria bacterium]MDP6271253.1 thiamine pyrophosphate-binding protein [Alphaproteobacteria bacterium]MDP7427429.1 thiamine pyrophosphate-binding protein [Alphaproteobacteria bacterium]HJM51425.1 thiamine pyrophosphate-binding protein [Alphaproteobacteria bacterium]